MTRALPAPAPVDVPDPAPPRTPPRTRRRRPGAAATCAASTAAAGVAAALPASRPAALALSALVIGWGGWALYRTARARASLAGALPAAGALTAAAGAVVAPGPLPAVGAAAVTTLLLAGHAAQSRAATRVEAPGPGDDAARRGAAALRQVADRAADGFAGLVVALAVVALGFWLGAGAGAGAALGAAAAVLLAACPGVLGAAASAALLAATGRAVELGVRPSGPRVLERAARVDAVVLCRTGALTTGVRTLHGVHAADGVDPDEALRLAGAVAAAARDVGTAAARHPVGRVVAAAARARFGALPGVAEFDGYPGLGLRGVVAELREDREEEPRVIAHAVLVGRPALLAEHGIALPAELAEAVRRVHATGSTAVAVSWDGVARAVLEVADPLRPGAAEAVHRLRALGLVPVLLTGDDAGAAAGLAAQLGVDAADVLAEVPRGDRAAAVDALRTRGRTVAVLGGSSDAEALAAADVALLAATHLPDPGESPASTGRVPHPDSPLPPALLPTSGESPVPTGRVPHPDSPRDALALRDADPLTAVDAVRVARRAVRTVQRIGTATLAHHLVALPLAAAGLLPPVVAALGAAVLPVAAVGRAAALRRVPAVDRPAPSAPEEGVTCR